MEPPVRAISGDISAAWIAAADESAAHDRIDMIGRMMEIRLARSEDLDGVLDVGRETWRATYVPLAGEAFVRNGLARWWTADGTLASIADGRVWVADADGQIVGMSLYGIKDRTVDIWKLYVAPAHQGQGIGTALLNSVVDATRHSADRVVVAYMDGNAGARAFYDRMAFVETHREASDLGGPDHVWMAMRAQAGP
jgi:GNAT superfamily N-acetyltransferase